MKEMLKPVRRLMDAGNQTWPDEATADLYLSLVDEEYKELKEARSEVERLDAVADLLWVLLGYATAKGWLIRSAWEEVARSNLAKIDPETGVVLKREDGKVLKPEGWTPPNLEKFLK